VRQEFHVLNIVVGGTRLELVTSCVEGHQFSILYPLYSEFIIIILHFSLPGVTRPDSSNLWEKT
jgi:hypothetical protein